MGRPASINNKVRLLDVYYKIDLIQKITTVTGPVKGTVGGERTVSDGAGLGFVKPDHSGVFGANLDLFEELQTQDNYI